jgi:hypothetical protein
MRSRRKGMKKKGKKWKRTKQGMTWRTLKA